MRVAYVHVLPVEYYPPATNTLDFFSKQPGWSVKLWTSDNERGMHPWSHSLVDIARSRHGSSTARLLSRSARYAQWHLATARSLAKWKPDAIVAVEPHSTLAVWLYYSLSRSRTPLFIHHHEYYSPEDFAKPGMRLLNAVSRAERDELLRRADWVSQTNDARMRMMLETHPKIRAECAHVLPNYPPSQWIERAETAIRTDNSAITRLVYVGSASFEDTFIREVCEWVKPHPRELSLHVAGNNVSPDVWRWVASLAASNITTAADGYSYDELPGVLSEFDAGLILYKGNTLNFVHNVPNKAIEYLACGLEVWYPPEMLAMRDFHARHPGLRTKEIDFKSLPLQAPHADNVRLASFPFTCESALAPLIASIEAGGLRR